MIKWTFLFSFFLFLYLVWKYIPSRCFMLQEILWCLTFKTTRYFPVCHFCLFCCSFFIFKRNCELKTTGSYLFLNIVLYITCIFLRYLWQNKIANMLGCLTNDQSKPAVDVFVALSIAKTFLFLLRLFFFLFSKCFTHSTLTTAFANFLCQSGMYWTLKIIISQCIKFLISLYFK